jgi:hypothetical protein
VLGQTELAAETVAHQLRDNKQGHVRLRDAMFSHNVLLIRHAHNPLTLVYQQVHQVEL